MKPTFSSVRTSRQPSGAPPTCRAALRVLRWMDGTLKNKQPSCDSQQLSPTSRHWISFRTEPWYSQHPRSRTWSPDSPLSLLLTSPQCHTRLGRRAYTREVFSQFCYSFKSRRRAPMSRVSSHRSHKVSRRRRCPCFCSSALPCATSPSASAAWHQPASILQ